MDRQDQLAQLRERSLSLDKAIKDIDYELERIVHSAASGHDVGLTISALQDRHNDQLGLMYDLGKVEAQISDLENRIQEDNERNYEAQAVAEWQSEAPAAENHLDWLQPVLDTPADDNRHQSPEQTQLDEAENRMLDDMHQDPIATNDDADWYNR